MFAVLAGIKIFQTSLSADSAPGVAEHGSSPVNTGKAKALKTSKKDVQSQDLTSLSLNVARRGHTATALADGRVVIIGGENQDGPIHEAEIIDPGNGTVSVVAGLRFARAKHSATLLPDGRVFVIGGSNKKGPLDSTEIFDPQTNSFSRGPRLSVARAGQSATLLKDGTLLIAGGRADGIAEIYDDKSGRFTLLKSKMNGPRSSHGAVLLKDGNVLIAGGIGPDEKTLDNAELFRPHTQGFYPIATWMYAERVRPELRVLPDGKVQIIGGDKKGTMEMYDPAGKFFRGFADLMPTAASLPLSSLLEAKTRAAFIDGAGNKDKEKTQQPTDNTPVTPDRSLFRADYTSTEIPQLNLAVIAGGVDDKEQFLQSVILVKSVPANVTTDHVDYPPEGRPIIGGSGWERNENIAISRLDTKTGTLISLRAAADGDGNFSNGDLSQADHQVGSYLLTAVGESSGYVAQTIYRSGPALDPAQAGKPPAKVKFIIPINGKDEGTVQSYDGPFKYKISRVSLSGGNSGIHPAGKIDFPTVDLDWTNKGINIAFLDWKTDGHLHFDGFIEVTLDIDFGLPPNPVCCACEVCPVCGSCDSVCDGAPCSGRLGDLKVTMKFVANFDASILNKFILSGTVFNVNDILVFPIGPAINIPPGPETGGFGFEAGFGLIGGIKLTFREPVKFDICFSLGANSIANLSAGISSGFSSSFSVTNDHASAGFEMIDLGSTCLQLSLGPGFVGKIYNETCSSLIGLNTRPVAGFIEGCLNANKDDPNCQKFNIEIAGGLKGDFNLPIGCGILSVDPIDIDHEYFRKDIANFPFGVFKDFGAPVITLPADIVQSTDPGVCTAAVAYSATAVDTCSGLKDGPLNNPGQIGQAVCIPPAGSPFPKGTTTVNCTATDNAGRQQACTNPSFNGNVTTGSFKVTVNDNEAPKLICPGPIVKSTDPGKCSAVTGFTVPTPTDNCPGETASCDPPPKSTFPKGTTTVTCTATDASGNQTSCSFTVTVNDTERPTITCPADLNAAGAGFCPIANTPVVTYPAPVANDNCPGVTTACVPPSGSAFPLGTTTVTCTATDTSGNTAAAPCTFTVTAFSFCLQDETSPGNLVFVNALTGDFFFCCGAVPIASGRGTLTVRSCVGSIDTSKGDRQVHIQWDTAANNGLGAGTAYVQKRSTRMVCQITDKNMINNSCRCSMSP